MLPERTGSRITWIFLASAILIIGCRVWLAAEMPLTDNTEARYSEMARKMVETGDWLMPQHDYGVPYMAKPPLAIWMSAIGIEMLGPNELGPRLLILLCSIGFLACLYDWIRREIGPGAAASGVLTLMGSMLFFFSMAAVMTDLILVACVDIALLAFWQRIHGSGRAAEWLFFALIGLGVLTKGPLAAFLVGAPILIWALLSGRLRETWQRFHWFRGCALAALIAVPWYLLAEWQHPGFLRYFLIGENLSRFLVADWKGDLYGPVHELPHGTIWLFLFIAALPWSLVGTAFLVRRRAELSDNWHRRRELVVFMLAAAGVPMLLFTAAQNVIFPYALPALIPGVIAALAVMGESMQDTRFVSITAAVAVASGLAFVFGSTLLNKQIEQESERELISAVEHQFNAPLDELYYWQLRYYSADYYGHGQVTVLRHEDDIAQMLRSHEPFYLAMLDEQFDALPDDLKQSLHRLGDYSKKALYGPASASPDLKVAALP